MRRSSLLKFQQDGELRFREHEILQLMADGKTCVEMAEIMKHRVNSIREYRSELIQKTGSKTAGGLVAWGYKNGILKVC